MLVKRPFLYSVDGVTTKPAVAGADVTDIPPGVIPGLVAEGYLCGGYTFKSVGFGRYRVVDGAGEPVSQPMTKAEAQAEAARLNGGA